MNLFSKKRKAEGQEPQKKSQLRDWTEALVVAAILALIIRTFVVQAFKIPSGSMEDTLLIGDHLLVNKFIYGLNRIASNTYGSFRFQDFNLGRRSVEARKIFRWP